MSGVVFKIQHSEAILMAFWLPPIHLAFYLKHGHSRGWRLRAVTPASCINPYLGFDVKCGPSMARKFAVMWIFPYGKVL